MGIDNHTLGSCLKQEHFRVDWQGQNQEVSLDWTKQSSSSKLLQSGYLSIGLVRHLCAQSILTAHSIQWAH